MSCPSSKRAFNIFPSNVSNISTSAIRLLPSRYSDFNSHAAPVINAPSRHPSSKGSFGRHIPHRALAFDSDIFHLSMALSMHSVVNTIPCESGCPRLSIHITLIFTAILFRQLKLDCLYLLDYSVPTSALRLYCVKNFVTPTCNVKDSL